MNRTILDRAARAIASGVLAATLAACGGGGGDSGNGGGGGVVDTPLSLSATYDEAGTIFQASTIHPTVQGLQGHAPRCSLDSGVLPQGLALRDDCTITGTPTQLGEFEVNIHLGAAGSTSWSLQHAVVIVGGPPAFYDFARHYTQGDAIDVLPEPVSSFSGGWTAKPGMVASYAVDEGTLAPGLVLDATTGRVHGTLTTAGGFLFHIGAHVSYNGQSAGENYLSLLNVGTPLFSGVYPRTSVYRGDPFSIVATPPPIAGAVFSYAFVTGQAPLSPIALDPSTGRLAGVILDEKGGCCLGGIQVTMDYAGQSSANFVDYPVVSQEPLTIRYAPGSGTVGQPFVLAPTIVVVDTQRSRADYRFAFKAPAILPPGLTFDATTGIVSGTPTARQCAYSSSMETDVIVDGRTFHKRDDVGTLNFQILEADGTCGP